jgi:predicted N-acetyltransferase YhbS
MTTATTQLAPLSTLEEREIDLLLDAAFGADRHNKTAYRLREQSTAIAPLSFAISDNHKLIASIQCWPVQIEGAKLVLVGPVAVHPAHQNAGHGRKLMQTMLEAAHKSGDPAMVMVGDPEYYARFGFTAELTAGWELPGPWDAHRLLARNIAEHPLPKTGMLGRADAL